MKSQFILLLSLTLSSSLVIGSDITRATGLRHTEVANTTVWVLPQLFNLDAANTSSIQVTNHSTTDTASLTIALRDQGGGAAVEQISAQLAPRATRNFPLNIVPLGYVGPAVVVCSRPCLVLGTWEFDLGGTKQFRVGIPALSARFTTNGRLPLLIRAVTSRSPSSTIAEGLTPVPRGTSTSLGIRSGPKTSSFPGSDSEPHLPTCRPVSSVVRRSAALPTSGSSPSPKARSTAFPRMSVLLLRPFPSRSRQQRGSCLARDVLTIRYTG